MSPSAKFTATLLSTAILALALALAGGGADARTTDRNQPMDIEAAHQVCGLGANDSCTYTDVTMIQGTLRIKAAKAVIYQVNGDMSRVQMSGGVTLHQQLDDGTNFDSRSSSVDYDLRNDVVVFTGNVAITQQRGTLNGERVVYNMKTDQIESGGNGNGRVKMTILPKSAQGAPAKAGD
ncbi:MAG TPA: lipopolysaccharide transport periplasmic protein LptA [Thermomonas sp.]|nr:lipopolysaccharide transport periplasmic protein LptA [Thermomonas sp.]